MLIIAQQGESAWHLQLGDSDNYMRLAQVRDFTSGQGWYDLVQHRVNPPHGLHTHWSRLADLPFAVPLMLLRTIISPDLAERLVVAAIPPLLLLVTMIATARLTDRLAGWRGSMSACLLLTVSMPVLAQFVPGRLDHHGLQILLLVAAVASVLGADRLKSGLAAAGACSLSLAVGLETAPYLLLIAFWLAALWLFRGPEATSTTIGFFLGLAVLTPVLFGLTVPASEWSVTRSDAFSGGHLAVVVVGSLAFLAATATRAQRLVTRATGAGVAAFLALIVAAQFPHLWSAPYSDVDPLMLRLWLDTLGETRSFLDYWRQAPLLAVASLWFIIATSVTAVVLAGHSRGRRRDQFILFALLTSMGALLTLWQTRSDGPATAIAVPIAASALAILWERWNLNRSSIIPLAAGAVLLNPISVLAAANIAQRSLGGAQSSPIGTAAHVDRCDSPGDFATLARLSAGLVVSPIDQSGTILVRTDHAVIAAANHRNASANASVYRALAAGRTTAELLVRRLRADYLVFCRSAPETAKIIAFAPHGLLSRVSSGEIPEWLEPVKHGHDRGLWVLRIRGSPLEQGRTP